jgi:hypothetical protein
MAVNGSHGYKKRLEDKKELASVTQDHVIR